MATDPNLSDEQKRRLRRDSSLPFGITGSTAVYSPVDRPKPEPGYRPTPQQRSLARSGVLSADADAAQGAFVAAEERALEGRQQALHERGARRLFRGTDAQGNSVYTDQVNDPLMSGAGEERFYGADGMRLDEGLTNPGRAADMTPGRGRAQGLRRAQTAFYDELDARNNQQLTAIGRRQPWVDAQNARNQEALYAQQVEGLQRQGYSPDAIAARLGGGRGGTGTDGAPGAGDMIRLMQFLETQGQNRITNERLDRAEDRQQSAERRQQLADTRRFSREDPEAYLREELGRLRGLDEGALQEEFSTDQGRLLRSNLDKALLEAEQRNRPFTFGLDALTASPGGFGDLRRAPFLRNPLGGGYTFEGDGVVGGVVRPEDLGISEDQFQMLMELYAGENALADRRGNF